PELTSMRVSFIATTLLLLVLCIVTVDYSPQPTSAAAPPATNPFFSESTLPFHAPPFDKITDSDYAPAIEAGMKDQLAEIEKIANDSVPPRLGNTLQARERSQALLTRLTKIFFKITHSNTNDTRQKIESDE